MSITAGSIGSSSSWNFETGAWLVMFGCWLDMVVFYDFVGDYLFSRGFIVAGLEVPSPWGTFPARKTDTSCPF